MQFLVPSAGKTCCIGAWVPQCQIALWQLARQCLGCTRRDRAPPERCTVAAHCHRRRPSKQPELARPILPRRLRSATAVAKSFGESLQAAGRGAAVLAQWALLVGWSLPRPSTLAISACSSRICDRMSSFDLRHDGMLAYRGAPTPRTTGHTKASP